MLFLKIKNLSCLEHFVIDMHYCEEVHEAK
jgi:hypothetical protein